ncbi:RTA1 like protein-domain-containing protein [Xylariales sp. PMI_506]|nr:RTA1 like protein-domain-containing protein [Xylariales sp. PMI_506]
MPYGYRPNVGVNAIFLISFASSLIAMEIVPLCTRRWLSVSLPLSTACLFEVIGYAVRIGGWANPWSLPCYEATTLFLTIAPLFISTSIYLATEKTLAVIGKEHSLIDPTGYSNFIYADLVALVVQLIGFGVAICEISVNGRLGRGAEVGGFIVAAGLALHVVTLIFFATLFTAALVRAWLSYREFGYTTLSLGRATGAGHRPLRLRFKVFLITVSIAVTCLTIRGLYRLVGFARGFDTGSRSEVLFALLDALMVSIAVLAMAVCHPAYALGGPPVEADEERRNGRVISGVSIWKAGARDVVV